MSDQYHSASDPQYKRCLKWVRETGEPPSFVALHHPDKNAGWTTYTHHYKDDFWRWSVYGNKLMFEGWPFGRSVFHGILFLEDMAFPEYWVCTKDIPRWKYFSIHTAICPEFNEVLSEFERIDIHPMMGITHGDNMRFVFKTEQEALLANTI